MGTHAHIRFPASSPLLLAARKATLRARSRWEVTQYVLTADSHVRLLRVLVHSDRNEFQRNGWGHTSWLPARLQPALLRTERTLRVAARIMSSVRRSPSHSGSQPRAGRSRSQRAPTTNSSSSAVRFRSSALELFTRSSTRRASQRPTPTPAPPARHRRHHAWNSFGLAPRTDDRWLSSFDRVHGVWLGLCRCVLSRREWISQ
jgi:hypothetical protein